MPRTKTKDVTHPMSVRFSVMAIGAFTPSSHRMAQSEFDQLVVERWSKLARGRPVTMSQALNAEMAEAYLFYQIYQQHCSNFGRAAPDAVHGYLKFGRKHGLKHLALEKERLAKSQTCNISHSHTLSQTTQ